MDPKNSQSPCRLHFKCFRSWGAIEWNGLLKVCVDISYQIKAIEVVEICFEEAAITDTWPAQCYMHSRASQFQFEAVI